MVLNYRSVLERIDPPPVSAMRRDCLDALAARSDTAS
jgi:hypothetical protein